MSLREQLENKQHRRLVVPVQITDPAAAEQAMQAAMHALRLAESRDPRQDGEVEACTAAVSVAVADVLVHYAQVELQSLPAAEWEAAMAEWTGEDGIDWAAALAPVLAVSCVDDSVRDEQFWADRLAAPSWTDGDRDQLKRALLLLNVQAPDPMVPKG